MKYIIFVLAFALMASGCGDSGSGNSMSSGGYDSVSDFSRSTRAGSSARYSECKKVLQRNVNNNEYGHMSEREMAKAMKLDLAICMEM